MACGCFPQCEKLLKSTGAVASGVAYTEREERVREKHKSRGVSHIEIHTQIYGEIVEYIHGDWGLITKAHKTGEALEKHL